MRLVDSSRAHRIGPVLRGCLATLAGAAIALAGCSSESADSTSSADDDYTVQPSGTNGLATVTVRAPASFKEVVQIGGIWYRYELSFNGSQVRLNQPSKVKATTTPGNWGCLRINIWSGDLDTNNAGANECIWQVAPGGTLTIDLGVAKLWWSGYPQARDEVFSLTTSSRGTLSRVWGDQRYAQYERARDRYAMYKKNDIPLLLAPGDYSYASDNANYPAKPFRVEPLKQIDLNVDNDAFLSTVELTYEDKEGFRDASPAGVQVQCKNLAGELKSTGFRDERWAKKLLFLDRGQVDCTLISPAGISLPLTLEGGQTQKLDLVRLNVDDVTVTDEGNRKATGTYVIRSLEGPVVSAWSQPTPTRTGYDLPKGRYEIAVTFTASTGPRTTTYEADLR
jgi:hypothetical protein